VLDEQIERLGLFYVRYMDDILVLAPTRWWLRKAVKVLNRVFATLRLENHPDKTFIGKIERGFDFLGYHFSPMGLRVATGTMVRFIEHAARLYEQERGGRFSSSPLGLYIKRWLRWVNAGIREDGMVLVLCGISGPSDLSSAATLLVQPGRIRGGEVGRVRGYAPRTLSNE